ncbi:MAG: hypothetical protein HKUEN01_06300 [Candidatus Kuenenia stuttgartiensis]|nr:MAG: hypothetical protein HKUEN01_06300 [Candidatus Kuenenia stuttgartiensis]
MEQVLAPVSTFAFKTMFPGKTRIFSTRPKISLLFASANEWNAKTKNKLAIINMLLVLYNNKWETNLCRNPAVAISQARKGGNIDFIIEIMPPEQLNLKKKCELSIIVP